MTVVATDADSTSPENDVTYTIPGEQQHEKIVLGGSVQIRHRPGCIEDG